MESRLPKPKIILKKTISSTTDMNSNNNNNNKQQVAKSGENAMRSTSTKTTNENKALVKPLLVRSKTFSTITQASSSKPVKRTATTAVANVTEAKRPFVKPKALANRPNALTSNATSKVAQNDTGKIQKWDLRGRLAQASDKLSVVQQKNKDIETKYNELQGLTATLKASEAAHKVKAENLEVSNKALSSELETLKVEMSTMQQQQEDLMKRLKESEESCAIASQTLRELQKEHITQGVLLAEQSGQLITLKAVLESQKKINEDLSTAKDELQNLTHKMDKERRLLHNNIQELKGNIRVFCRVRPRTSKEIELMKTTCSINFLDDCTVEIGKLDGSDTTSYNGKQRCTKQEFSFDKVFAPNASQADIFEELSLLVQSALEGYNVCVFAYGQTGSGKTYTMEGDCGLETEGMIPRTVRHIFKEMKQFELLGWQYRIEASFLEIYNEHIVDLLDSQPKSHEIRMVDSKGQDLYVSNLQIEEINNPDKLHECLRTAQRNRAVAATQSNERSSRSHSVTRIRLIGTHTTKQEVSVGNLNLVDLAGSERLKSEEVVRTTETKNINKSLANLGNVILALLKKQEHVPYRNSKLTHLLMPSLGGNSKTLMLLNISPIDECYNETLNSLRFASSVNSCKTGNVKRSRMLLNNNTSI
ncbi:PREDICTED: protein claret segregational [Dinoponera quadriceps]|uniref:Protein claret segregational n=1 Tax=Dinoponera quadriceps TaxID=609295 RepID=A0A6P3XRI8_DINQU|nr:PREDICTED: protein claret segregational [Dinoponera quadriceps]XP_014481120.1 PREDICTED: protein claret segregational [Dinoponera quadriceps]